MTEHEGYSDAEWQTLLRANTAEPPVDRVDWQSLHTRITNDAAPVLRRRVGTWWQLLGSRATHEFRNAAAVAAMAVLLLSWAFMPDRPATAQDTAVVQVPTIEEELTASLAYSSVPLLAADADRGDVLDALLFYDGDDR